MDDRPIVNIAELEYRRWGNGDRFDARVGAVGGRLGAQKLGYNVTVLAPGKRAFPFHNHRVNEEMFFVLEGEGEIRIGESRHAIRGGDVIACPAGGAEAAHQIVNTSSAELKYLAVSTRLSPEIVEYPDSEKFGVQAEFPAGADGQATLFRFVSRVDANVDYWDGE
jgi:uncharacterized cupin superfamily protein